MSASVTVTAIGGPYIGRKFAFTIPMICTVGRSGDCLLRIPGGTGSLDVSRHHCRLDIDPPVIRVRDLGSLNGTFVNERKIGQRDKNTPPWEAIPADGVELHDGDRLVVGSSQFVIDIQAPISNQCD
jgi:serine/threonine-protein kinase